MTNQEHLDILKQGTKIWNHWRKENKGIIPMLSKADLSGMDLSNFDLSGAYLIESNFFEANLFNANLSKSSLAGSNLTLANLRETNLQNAYLFNASLGAANLVKANLKNAILIKTTLVDADLSYANLSSANLSQTNLFDAIFKEANLQNSDLSYANLSSANLSQANLSNANLKGASLLDTNLENANISNAKIYGVSVWGIKGKIKNQKDLLITPPEQPAITVDNIEVAQFIYLMLNNEKIRDVIGTIAKKGVLILGRFSPKRKKILDAIREKLRQHDFVPMMFDFEKVESRDYTETVKILAGMSRFVIVDVTHQSSSPLELQATVPDFKIPFIPLILKEKDEKGRDIRPFAMLIDLIRKYEWVSGVLEYENEEELIGKFQKEIIDEALTIEKTMKEKERQSYFRDNR